MNIKIQSQSPNHTIEFHAKKNNHKSPVVSFVQSQPTARRATGGPGGALPPPAWRAPWRSPRRRPRRAAGGMLALVTLLLSALLMTNTGSFLLAEDSGYDEYDLNKFLNRIESHSKDLELARKELDMAAVHKKEALSTALPKVFLQVDYKRNLKDNFLYIDFPDFDSGEMTNQKFKINYNNEYGMQAVVNQTLFSFQVGTALKAAKHSAPFKTSCTLRLPE